MAFLDDQEPPNGAETPIASPRPASGAAAGTNRIADDQERSLHPDTITVERLTRSIATAIFAGISLVLVLVLLLSGLGGWTGRFLLPAAWLTTCATLGVFGLWWPAVRYRHTSYRVSDDGIRIRRGVIWRAVTSVPKSRVQHTDVSQGPIERMFDLATLVIYTAGTQFASVHLPGLAWDDALQIRDYLIRGGEGDAV